MSSPYSNSSSIYTLCEVSPFQLAWHGAVKAKFDQLTCVHLSSECCVSGGHHHIPEAAFQGILIVSPLRVTRRPFSVLVLASGVGNCGGGCITTTKCVSWDT